MQNRRMLGPRLPAVVLLPFMAAAVASFSIIGGDARWFAAVGALVAGGHLPGSLPFATAPTAGWHDAPALGQLVFHALEWAAGDRGLVAAHVAAVSIGFAALAAILRRSGGGLAVGAVILVATLPALLLTTSSLFSLALFPLLLLLLHDGRRLWWAVPLIALWANLYGGVLVGWALLAVYVVVACRRAWPILALSTIALVATAALWHTPAYYLGVFQNEAARRGMGMWSPLDHSPFAIVLVLAAVVLAVSAGRNWQRWEIVAAAGLAAGTVHTMRLGTYLLFVLAAPAARGRLAGSARTVPVAFGAVLLLAVAVGVSTRRTDAHVLAERAAKTGKPVLGDVVASEQVELLGGRVWVSNPLDAFSSADQELYVDWLLAKPEGRAAVDHAQLVLVHDDTKLADAASRDSRLRVEARAGGYVLFARR